MNDKRKRSRWFPKGMRPKRAGWCECATCHEGIRHARHFWNGKMWCTNPNAGAAILINVSWRGLARQSK